MGTHHSNLNGNPKSKFRFPTEVRNRDLNWNPKSLFRFPAGIGSMDLNGNPKSEFRFQTMMRNRDSNDLQNPRLGPRSAFACGGLGPFGNVKFHIAAIAMPVITLTCKPMTRVRIPVDAFFIRGAVPATSAPSLIFIPFPRLIFWFLMRIHSWAPF